MRAPRLSILLPVHNAEPYLETCLRALARQTFTDFEVIAIDDGSTDGSGERLCRWARRDSRWRVIRRPAQGLVPTLNQALEQSAGEWVARLDADDAMPAGRFESQLRALEDHPDVDVVSCLVRHFPRLGLGHGLQLYERWLNSLTRHEEMWRERFVESPLPHPTIMMRRQTLIQAGGYRDMGWPEDYDLWLRLMERGCRFHKVPRVLYFWRDHGRRLTRTDRRYTTRNFLACKAHFLVRGPLANASSVLIWGAGQTGKRFTRYLLDQGGTFAAAIDIDPRKIGGRLRGRPVYAPDALARLRDEQDHPVLLAAVSARGARELIRGQLERGGWREGKDYWCVA